MSVFQNYANALTEKASDNDLQTYIEDLKEFLNLSKSSEVQNYLKSPVLSSDRKIALLKEPLAALNEKVVRLLRALIKRNHSLHIFEAVKVIIRELETKAGIEAATVWTPVNLEESEIDAFRVSLSKIINKKVIVKTVLDRSLIAGFKVQVAGKFFDNSVSNQLVKLRKRFDISEGKYEN